MIELFIDENEIHNFEINKYLHIFVYHIMKMDSKTKIGIRVIIVFVLCIITYFFRDKLNIITYISIIGSYASLFGIWISYEQIKSVKDISKITQQSIEKNLSEVNLYLSYSDISKTIKIIYEIENYILISKLEPALIRMRDLKLALIQISQNSRLIKEDDKKKLLTTHITNLGIDIANVYSHIKDQGELDPKVINQNLENATTYLAELESKLKFQKL